MCNLCLNFHNKTMIHTIEQVSTGDGHIELNHVRITPEERQKRIQLNKRQRQQYKKSRQSAMEMFRLNKINMNGLFLKGVICKSVTTQLTCRWKPKAWKSGAASDSSHLLLYYHCQHRQLYNWHYTIDIFQSNSIHLAEHAVISDWY